MEVALSALLKQKGHFMVQGAHGPEMRSLERILDLRSVELGCVRMGNITFLGFWERAYMCGESFVPRHAFRTEGAW